MGTKPTLPILWYFSGIIIIASYSLLAVTLPTRISRFSVVTQTAQLFIFNSLSFLCFHSTIYHRQIKKKKLGEKIFFMARYLLLPIWQSVWHRICSGCHFGSPRAPSAILAVVSSAIMAGANRPVWVVQPPVGGVLHCNITIFYHNTIVIQLIIKSICIV